MAQPDQAAIGVLPSADAGNLPFPASTRQAAGVVGGVKTDVTSVSFADKLLFTITQNGRLAHWVCITPGLYESGLVLVCLTGR